MKRLPLILTIVLTAAFAVYFSWFDIARHHKTNSSRFDLGNVEQVEWNLIHGRGFTETDPYGTMTVSRFNFHADPFLIALAPLYAMWPRTETLLVLQVLAVASGGLVLFFIARKVLSPIWAVVLTGVYVLNPALQWTTIFDVHAVAFAIPLTLWAIWAAMKKKYWWTLVLIMLAMTTKEEIGFGLMAIGVYVLWRHKKTMWGSALILVPLLWSITMFFTVLPSFHSLPEGNSEVYQTIFGSGADSVVKGAIEHPLKFGHQLLSRQNLVMAGQLLAPLGWFPVGSWWSLGATPDYTVNALSLKPAQHLLMSHYASGELPWLFVGTVMMLAWLCRIIQQRVKLPHDQHTLLVAIGLWLIGWAVYGAYAWGPLPAARNDDSRVAIWRNVYAAPVAEWEKKIPSSAAVSVTNNVGSHFARRENFYSFPLGIQQSDYAVVLEGHATPVVVEQNEVTAAIAQLRQSPDWTILDHEGDLTVLKHN